MFFDLLLNILSFLDRVYDRFTPFIGVYRTDFVLNVVCVMCVIYFLTKIVEDAITFNSTSEYIGYKEYIKTRVWTIVATIVVGFLGINTLYTRGINPYSVSCAYIEAYDVEKSIDSLAILTGYFLYDILFRKPAKEYVIHHSIGIVASFIIMASLYSPGAFYTQILLITELSTIFLNMYHLCVNTKILKIFSMIMFTVTYTIVRVVYIFVVLTKIFQCAQYEPFDIYYALLCIMVFALYALNIYWYCKLIAKLSRIVSGKDKNN